MRTGLTLLATLAGCAPKHVPSHLQVGPQEPTVVAEPPASLEAAVAQLTEGDPLVRRPAAHDPTWWGDQGDTAPIAAWSSMVGSGRPSRSSLDALETAWPGTVAVPLARGARLAQLEVDLPAAPADDSGDRALALWLGSVTVAPRPGPSDVRPPLGWLGTAQSTPREGLLEVMEQDVLLGWLSSPAIPLAPVEAAMVAGTYDRLRARPEGALITARAKGGRDAAAGATGAEALRRATHLALVRVAADRPAQQDKAQRLAKGIATELGLEASANPLPVLLQQGWDALLADAADDRSSGLALVTVAAQRLSGSRLTGPPESLDRIATLRQATGWHTDVEPYAWAWRLIAAKDALDQLTISEEDQRSTVAFPLVADIIVGESRGRVPLSLLLQQRLGPAASLAITRGLGSPDGTSPQDALSALSTHIHALCGARPEAPLPDPAWHPAVARICAE